jgi:hypothetical protein
MTRIKPKRRTRWLAGAAVALCALAPAAPADADLIETGACDDAALSHPFASFGDNNWYKLAPGGDFEGEHGWKLSGGARLVSGSSTFGATGEAGSSAVSIPAGGSVTSPATCVNFAYPTLRFFSKSSGGLLGLLPVVKVDVLYGEGLAKILPLPAGTALPGGRWQPTLPGVTLSAVGATLNGGEAPIAIRISSLFGTWTVDDVFVDPTRRI